MPLRVMNGAPDEWANRLGLSVVRPSFGPPVPAMKLPGRIRAPGILLIHIYMPEMWDIRRLDKCSILSSLKVMTENGPATITSSVEAIVQSVRTEFGGKAEQFVPIVVRMDALQGAEFDATKSPGVYIFIHEDNGCLKVGKSHSNASKRALEHLRDNTSSKDKSIQMAQLRESDKTYMLIFALRTAENLHWILALEHYLEKTLKPKITSIRNG